MQFLIFSLKQFTQSLTNELMILLLLQIISMLHLLALVDRIRGAFSYFVYF